jgi:hypothetical protein
MMNCAPPSPIRALGPRPGSIGPAWRPGASAAPQARSGGPFKRAGESTPAGRLLGRCLGLQVPKRMIRPGLVGLSSAVVILGVDRSTVRAMISKQLCFVFDLSAGSLEDPKHCRELRFFLPELRAVAGKGRRFPSLTVDQVIARLIGTPEELFPHFRVRAMLGISPPLIMRLKLAGLLVVPIRGQYRRDAIVSLLKSRLLSP